MGSRMFLLLALVLLMFIERSQGFPERHKESLIVRTSTAAADVGKPLTTANPVNTPRQHNRLCNCKGQPGKGMTESCNCQLWGKTNRKNLKWAVICEREKNKMEKICRWWKRHNKSTNLGPSVPI